MKKGFFVCVFFLMMTFNLPAGHCTGKTLVINSDMQYAYALDRYDHQDFNTAVIELKRFVYFFPDDERIAQAKLMIGKSLFYLEEYDEAVTFFNTITDSLILGKIEVESYFMLSNTYLVMDRAGDSKRVLYNLLVQTQDPEIRDRAHSALYWISLKQAGEFETAALDDAMAAAYQISDANARQYHKTEMLQAIHDLKSRKGKNPVIAGLAGIIPGAGFFYCERYHDGTVALILNAAMIAAAVTSFDSGNNALGGLLTVVEAGFYSGSIYGSISSAHKYNRTDRTNEIDRLKTEFSNLEPSDISDRTLKLPWITLKKQF